MYVCMYLSIYKSCSISLQIPDKHIIPDTKSSRKLSMTLRHSVKYSSMSHAVL